MLRLTSLPKMHIFVSFLPIHRMEKQNESSHKWAESEIMPRICFCDKSVVQRFITQLQKSHAASCEPPGMTK